MIVPLPHTLDAWSMYGLITRLISKDKKPLHAEVSLDFSTLAFIKPVGITILSNLIELLKKQGVKVSFRDHNGSSAAIRYLDDSLFFEQYLKKKIFELSEVRATTLPLRLLKHQETSSWLEYKLIPWLGSRLNMSSRSFGTIRTCLQELFNNINDHAREDIGSIFVQQYPNKKLINIALSDFGVGIPYNVNKIATPVHDGEAILFATREGFTSRSNPRNGGAGLDIFLNTLSKNKGKAIIYSNLGALSCSPTTRRPWLAMDGQYYPGTLFDINFRTDTIEISDESEEERFEW